MNIISTLNLDYNKSSKIFSQKISQLPIPFNTAQSVIILNPKTKVSKVYTFEYADMDGSGEDTYGWNYRNKETGTRLLIIND